MSGEEAKEKEKNYRAMIQARAEKSSPLRQRAVEKMETKKKDETQG